MRIILFKGALCKPESPPFLCTLWHEQKIGPVESKSFLAGLYKSKNTYYFIYAYRKTAAGGIILVCSSSLFYLMWKYVVDLPAPSRFNSPDSTILRREPSTELRLKDGHSSRISCFVNLPIVSIVALRTTSTAGSFSSTKAKRYSKSLYAARIFIW